MICSFFADLKFCKKNSRGFLVCQKDFWQNDHENIHAQKTMFILFFYYIFSWHPINCWFFVDFASPKWLAFFKVDVGCPAAQEVGPEAPRIFVGILSDSLGIIKNGTHFFRGKNQSWCQKVYGKIWGILSPQKMVKKNEVWGWCHINDTMWVPPKIMVPPNHPFE